MRRLGPAVLLGLPWWRDGGRRPPRRGPRRGELIARSAPGEALDELLRSARGPVTGGGRRRTIAPMIAIPSEPPTWRNLLSTADPTPALSTGTAPIAAADVGAIDIAIPAPPMRSAGSMSQKFE